MVVNLLRNQVVSLTGLCTLLDVSGRLVLPINESSATSTKINTQRLLPGIYFLHAKTQKELIVKKLVKF